MTSEDKPLAEQEIYTITRLNREVRAILEGSFPALMVQGELSNLARPSSGHLYFSLKDSTAQVRCAMFRGRNRLLKFNPENGMEVLARAEVSLYEGRGEFQLIIDTMEPAGVGALQRAFEELKQRLYSEGFFDQAHKRDLPACPSVIGVITSPGGAAVRDIIDVLRRRFPIARIIIYPSSVQGEGAAGQLIAALRQAERRREVDVLILARGGGTMEDLWCFNDENLARAIYGCTIPLISGIGHEIDFSIADFVADVRAPTPSAAAELATPDAADLAGIVLGLRQKLHTCCRFRVYHCRRELEQLEKRIPHPRRVLQACSQRLDTYAIQSRHMLKLLFVSKSSALTVQQLRLRQLNPSQRLQSLRDKCATLHKRLMHSATMRLGIAGYKLRRLQDTLQAVSPQATLDRGYAIVTHVHGDTIVRDVASLRVGETLKTRVARGAFQSTVTKSVQED